MQGALYFPYIGVPETAWWTRTMLYWDNVATIVPRPFINDPELHNPYTLELIRAGLLHQVFPEDVGFGLSDKFSGYLERLSGPEIDRRRRDFLMGHVSRIHCDKWLTYPGGLNAIEKLGLAYPREETFEWISVEATTAAEFMAALALALCEAAGNGGWRSVDQSRSETWVPTTDTPPAMRALLAGLDPVSNPLDSEQLHLRVRGELQVAEIRTHLLTSLLPVPATAVPVEKLVKFRRVHARQLPKFRRYLESKIDESLMISDPVLQSRFIDRIGDELQQRSEEAEAYMRELGLRRISRSSMLRVLKFIPVLSGSIQTAQDLAENLRTSQNFEAQPLAYLAFAYATFAPVQNYKIDPTTGVPLIEAIQQDDDKVRIRRLRQFGNPDEGTAHTRMP
jgi:hypothetical protein